MTFGNIKINVFKSTKQRYQFHGMIICMQKQSPGGILLQKGVLRNFTKFTGKHLCQRLFFNKVAVSFYEKKPFSYFSPLLENKAYGSCDIS